VSHDEEWCHRGAEEAWIRFLVVLSAAVLVIGCGVQDRGSPYETPVHLPIAWQGEAIDTTGWTQIDLTADGLLRYDGDFVTLGRLKERLQQLRESEKASDSLASRVGDIEVSKRPILLCVDRSAPYVHAAWIFDALWRRGYVRIWLGVRMGALQGALAAPLVCPIYGADPSGFDPTFVLPELVVHVSATEDGRPEFELFPDRPLRNAMLLEARLAHHLTDSSHGATLGVLGARSDAPFHAFVTALDRFHAACLRNVEWTWEQATPWIDAQPVLPRFDRRWWISMYGFSARDIAPIDLPVAGRSVPDRADDPDDRLILNLDSKGGIPFKRKERSLDEIGIVLDQAKRIYDLKMRSKGKQGHVEIEPGVRRSRLFVLIRADKNAPWQQVSWILKTIADNGLCKVQFATQREVDMRYSRAEAALLGADWRTRRPPPPYQLEAKLPCFLPVGPADPKLVVIRIRILPGAKGRPVYRLGSREIDDILEVGRSLQAAGPQSRGVLEADAEVPHKFVVAVLNLFRAAGIERVDLALPQDIPEDVRSAVPLPAPASTESESGSGG
jgi:biopolymer transport protein ExbD